MNSLERLEQESWSDKIKEDVREYNLIFKDWRGLNYIRDYVHLKNIEDDKPTCICFAQGTYDNWAAVVLKWVSDTGVSVAFPTDEYYFSRLALLGLNHGFEKVYNSMLCVYALVDSYVRMDAVDYLEHISLEYGEDSDIMYNMMMHVYFGMIAEEHYQRVRYDGGLQRTKLGKVMKMYALYRLLIERVPVEECAKECVGVNPTDILEKALDVGIIRYAPIHAYDTAYDNPKITPVTKYGAKKKK